MILAWSERERDGPKKCCSVPRRAGGDSPSRLGDLPSGDAMVRGPRPI